MKIEFMSDASNESTGFDFDIYCKKADLTISNLRVDHYGTPRYTLVAISNIEFFNLSYDVQIVDAQARFNINWYLSHDSILDVIDSLLGEETDFGSNIWSPQDLNDFSLEVPIPYVDSAGKYFIIGEIDPENYTIESDETNNLLVKEVEITKIIDDSVHVYGDKNLTTCNDTIYDHNKEGLYSYGLTSTMTVSPTEHQTKITRLTFLEFDLEDGVDFLIVNGDSLTGSNLPSTIYGEFDGGAKGIDLHFFSSSQGLSEGFAIEVDCISPIDIKASGLNFEDGFYDRLWGENTSFDFEIENLNFSTAYNVKYEVYFSNDSLLDAGDDLQYTKSLDSLVIDSIYSITDTVSMGLYSDTLHLIVKVTSSDSLADADLNNQVLAKEFFIHGDYSLWPNLNYEFWYHSGNKVFDAVTDQNTHVVSCFNNDTLIDEGVNFDYYPRQDRFLSLSAGTRSSVELEWLEFDLALDDTLFIYEGTDTLSSVLAKFTGSSLPPKLKSLMNNGTINLRLKTNGVNQGEGFKALMNCNGTDYNLKLDSISHAESYFVSDSSNSISFYISRNDTLWGGEANSKIYLSEDNRLDSLDIIVATHDSFFLVGQNSIVDSLRIEVPDSIASGVYYFIYESHSETNEDIGVLPNFPSDTNKIFIDRDYSDNRVIEMLQVINPKYWEQSALFIKDSIQTITTCDENIRDDRGGLPYSSNFNGGLILKTGTSNQKLKITFESFDVGTGDTLHIYANANFNSPNYSYVKGDYLSGFSLVSHLDDMKIEFISDSQDSSWGFSINVACETLDLTLEKVIVKQGADTIEVIEAGSEVSFYYDVLSNKKFGIKFGVNWYLSDNELFDTEDELIYEDDYYEAINNYFDRATKTTITTLIPQNTLEGFYYLLGVVDVNDSVAESNETNNVIAKAIEVTPFEDEVTIEKENVKFNVSENTLVDVYDIRSVLLYRNKRTSQLTTLPRGLYVLKYNGAFYKYLVDGD